MTMPWWAYILIAWLAFNVLFVVVWCGGITLGRRWHDAWMRGQYVVDNQLQREWERRNP